MFFQVEVKITCKLVIKGILEGFISNLLFLQISKPALTLNLASTYVQFVVKCSDSDIALSRNI